MALAHRPLAVVTGGNKGIGFEICRILLAQGVDVILAARSRERGEAALNALTRDATAVGTCTFSELDLADPASIVAFVERTEKLGRPIDVLINNAAIAYKAADPTPFGDQAVPTLAVNYHATRDLTEKMVPLLRRQGGRVVFVASRSGSSALSRCAEVHRSKIMDPHVAVEELDALAAAFAAAAQRGEHLKEGFSNSCYGMSKALVLGYTRHLALRLAPEGIVVFSCCPGSCSTDMSSHRGYLSAAAGADTPAWLALDEQAARICGTGAFVFQREVLLAGI